MLATPVQGSTSRVSHVCGPVLPGFAHCNAETVGRPKLSARAAGGSIPYGPADIQSAYGLTDAIDYGADQTVAIVDAYDLPSAASDLATYRSHYGLRTCTIANGCFRKVNQNGVAGNYPPADAGWGGEIALDLDAVSATCPHCRILLVEANSSSMLDLAAAVDRAAAMGATQISNSYGGNEFAGETIALESHYNHPGIAETVSSGDDGYGVEYPAASRYVTAVGGTSLHVDGSSPRGWSETAWAGAGSGCSLYVIKPAWQTDTDCLTRSVADVSAVADPYTGIAAYDSYDGWMQVGGTSLSSPIVAAIYALTGSAASASGFAYNHTDWFNDVTGGANGSCTFTYLCTALAGFDGPTGIGTPASAHPSGSPPPDTADPTPIPPTTTTTTTQPTPTPAVAKSSVLVSRAAVQAAVSGRLTVKITCGGGPACSGVLNLQTKLRGAGLRTLGKGKYSVASGASVSVSVRLSHSSLSYLAKKHVLTVYGTALDSDGTTAQSSFRLRAPKKHKHRKH